MTEVSVIIPTYQERDNLARLLPAVLRVLYDARLSGEIIVVDDDSRDGTENLCFVLGTVKPVRLITRRDERGLATAVVRGLEAANGEVCVVMDADFSHPPEAVPKLVAAMRDGHCEMAIGSRYVTGGAVDEHWGWFRRANSRVATLLARGLTKISDPMAGFFAIRKSTVERAGQLRPLGYKIALELIVRCDCRRVVEVPILFQDRAAGESKMSVQQQWLYLRHLTRLYGARFAALRQRAATAATIGNEPSNPERRAA
ncbi:MAG: polyprenol monophosphomannose synthase [Pirellulales bacterium]